MAVRNAVFERGTEKKEKWRALPRRVAGDYGAACAARWRRRSRVGHAARVPSNNFAEKRTKIEPANTTTIKWQGDQ